jgi:hypothetical protein
MRGKTSILFALGALWLTAGAAAAPPARLDPDALDLDVPPALAATPQARKAQLLARARELKAPTVPASAAKSIVVDCAKGDKLQTAIDKNPGEVTFEVRGLCHENVKVDHRKITLHGADPATDGIRGVASDPPVIAALEVWYSELVRVENLSISHPSADVGLGIFHSGVEALNCRMIGNPDTGVHVSASSFLFGTELTLSDNGRLGLHARRGSLAFCTGCRLENNAVWAATTNFGGLLSLHDSVVAGTRGLQAANGSYADLDCLSEDTAFPCSLNVTRTAGFAFADSTVAMYGAGAFAGQLVAGDRGQIYVYGAQQTATGVGPGGNPLANSFDSFATLLAEPSAENGLQSQLKGHTQVSTFSRALLIDATTVDGTLACDSAGDAWADAGVTVSGGPITGCEHVPAP